MTIKESTFEGNLTNSYMNN